jgi:poly-gamma-glutamate synthesis protein (capsule biosynthesis protein)
MRGNDLVEEPENKVHLALAGDVMLGRLVNVAIERLGAAYPWGDFRPLLADADLTILNLECVIATDGRPWERTAKVFHFRADPIALESLRLAGVDGVILANNHVLDWEVESLFEMLLRLDEHKIVRVGAGRDHTEAERPAFLEAKGLRIGLVAFTDNEPGWAAGRYSPGTNYAPVSVRPTDFIRISGAIARARAASDVVIFSNHWGPNMRERPPAHFREFAHAVLDAGADAYFGHSAHIFQGIEVYRGKPLIYDAGDFVDDYAVDPNLRNDRGLLYLLTVDAQGVQGLELVPALIEHCQVNRAKGREFDTIAMRIQQLSAEFGTTVAVAPDRLRVDLQGGAQRRVA